MHYTRKFDILRKALILSLFVIYIPITFIFLLYKDAPGLSTFFKEYLISGKSLFLPFLPYNNILWFLPEEYQFIQFSTGHLTDIILIINIVTFVEISSYHYLFKGWLNDNYQESFLLGSEEPIFNITQKQDIFFEFREEPRLILEERILNIKFKKNQRLTEKTEDFHENMTKQEYKYRIIERGRLPSKSYRYRNKVSQVFCYISIISDTLLLNQTLYPQICYINDSTQPIQYEG